MGVVLLDEVLTRATHGRVSLPPLAVGMGMYLPITQTLVIPIGAFLGLAHDRWAARRTRPETARRMGTLLATGLIVGESLFGVVFAAIVAASGREEPLALVGDGFAHPAQWLGGLVMIAVLVWLYGRIRRVSTTLERSAPAEADPRGSHR